MTGQDSLLDELELASSSSSASTSSKSLTLKRTSTILSTKSTATQGTFLPRRGGYGGEIAHLCRLIESYTSLQSAEIVATECYTTSAAKKDVPKFLLAELKRGSRKTIWIRLDRIHARSFGALGHWRGKSFTRVNDNVSSESTFEYFYIGIYVADPFK